MKRSKSIAFKLIAWIIVIVIFFQSIVFLTAFLIFNNSTKTTFKDDNASICDRIKETCDTDYYDSVLEIQIDDYQDNYPNKPYEDLTVDERNAYTAAFDNLNQNLNYSYYTNQFQLMGGLSVSDYLTFGFVDIDTQKFVGLYIYTAEDNKDIREVGFYMDIPEPIKNCMEKGIDNFDGESYTYNGIEMFSTGRKFDKTSSNQTAWLLLDQKMSTITKDFHSFLMYFFAITFSLTIAILVVTVIVLYKIGLIPMKKLSKQSLEYTKALESGKISDTFSEPSKKQDEIGQLHDSFYYLDKELRNYVEQVKTATSKAEKLDAELKLAKKIQLSTLPNNFLYDKDFSIDAFIRPAKLVGGDLYGFEKISEEVLYFYIGDVSGKGIPASLFMMQTKTLLQENLTNGDLLKAVQKTNARLTKENSQMLFITAFIGIINLKTGELKYINAAHEPIFIKHNGVYTKLTEKADVPLATIEDFPYSVQKIKLHKGDRLFLYTDGVSEAMNKDDQLYGKKKIEETLNTLCSLSNKDTVKAMVKSVDEYAKGVLQSDDICMLSFTYLNEDEMVISSLEDLERVNGFVSRILGNKLSSGSISKINVVLDELLNNVISYSGLQGETFLLTLSYDEKNKEAKGTIKDKGIPFNPLLSKPNKDEARLGGYGILLSKSLMDSLNYKREGEYNILTFTKKDSK